MWYWQNRLIIHLLFLPLGLVTLTSSQGWQYIAAYAGGGFANRLPQVGALPDAISCDAQPLRVLSFNVRYGSTLIESVAKQLNSGDTGEGFLPWSVRAPEIRDRINSYTPDLLGLQEMEGEADIKTIVPLEQYTLVSYRYGAMHYADAALLYKTTRFEQLDHGQVWLGPNPDLPMSFGFKPLAMIRYINWVMLREKATGFTFMFVNTHFDNARKNKDPSATLFRERIAKLSKGLPLVVSGDFNSTAASGRYQRLTGEEMNPPLLENTYDRMTAITNTNTHPNQLDDHILVGGPCRVKADQWIVDSQPLKSGQPMSDHRPVFAQLDFSS
jgi:endonuclease/exonuclease/phosphatase family metal-dependent hydrolase